jgi:hypothetical protein
MVHCYAIHLPTLLEELQALCIHLLLSHCECEALISHLALANAMVRGRLLDDDRLGVCATVEEGI